MYTYFIQHTLSRAAEGGGRAALATVARRDAVQRARKARHAFDQYPILVEHSQLVSALAPSLSCLRAPPTRTCT